MEHTRKMLLVEPEAIERLKRPLETVTPLSSLDQQMRAILKSNKNDNEKWKLYQQTLQRYLHFTNRDRQPIPMFNIETYDASTNSVDSNNDNDTESTKQIRSYSKEDILTVLPKSYIKKGDNLLNNLVIHKDRIKWNDQGVVSIDGELISGSNIADMVGHLVRPLKRSEPVGMSKFLQLLYEINLPLQCIGNPKHSEFIHKLNMQKYIKQLKSIPQLDLSVHQKSLDLLEKENESSIDSKHLNQYHSTPNTSNTTGKRIKWEKWSP